MVVLTVPRTPLLGAIAAASAHGLTDLSRLQTAPLELAPYSLVFLPMPTNVVTPIFLMFSVQHFAHDIGRRRSVLLHCTFAIMSLVQPVLAWTLFALYYIFLHVPRHLAQHLHECKHWLKLVMAAATIFFPRVVGGPSSFFIVTDWMQKGVIAHVLVDELYPSRHGDGGVGAVSSSSSRRTVIHDVQHEQTSLVPCVAVSSV